MRIPHIACLLLLFTVTLQAQAALPMPVSIGVTDLLIDGHPTVGYQFDGKAPVSLGYDWNGYSAESGVYFTPEDTLAPGGQVFMHCPWVGGAGIAFADYAVKLPQTGRVRLQFEIALRSGAQKSDGVTYRVRMKDQVVFEQHCAWKAFRPFEVDLSPFAGTQTVLRLEVDPGPARNTSDDWSLWRSVRLLCGDEAQIAAAKAEADALLMKARAADLTVGEKLGRTSLVALTSHEVAGVRPSTLSPVSTSVRKEGDAYLFTCRGDETVEYRFVPAEGLVSGLSAAVNGKVLSPAPFQGGPRVHLDGVDFPLPSPTLTTQLVGTQLDGDKVTCRYRYTNPKTGSTARLRATLWAEGKSVGLELSGEPDRFSGFAAQPAGGRPITATFAAGPPIRRADGYYASVVVDRLRTDASGVASGAVTSYRPLTNGKRNALHDVLFLTLSSRFEETLSNSPFKASPFLEDLAHRVVLDGWGGNFADNEQWLKDMSLYGIDRFLMIKHVWQRDGYDHTYPDTMPANASMGGDEALRSLSLTAQELGHEFCVHENYYDYYPNAESFKEADRLLNSEGKPVDGWDNGQVRAVILKPSKLMDYVREFTPQIKQRYGCNAAYHDIMPTWHVDFDAKAPGAGMIRYTHEQTQALCDYDRAIFGGPVVFEAADPMMAGTYDGGCNHGVDTYLSPTAVAYEVLKVHPRQSNHGFGYYERWLPWGYSMPVWGSYVMTDRELDKYRAFTIAFGRTGFIGQQLMKHAHGVVREYHLMQAFGRAYTGQLANRIRYEVGGKMVDAATAARYSELSRINVEYEGGQQVYVNLADKPWRVAGQELPSNGSFTTGPRGTAGTVLRDGQICDLAQYDKVTYCDARSQQWLPPTALPSIEPSVASFKALGGKEFELTVNWKVGRALDRDYTIFWHFMDEGIAFQSDHSLARATTSWKVGETITDGPRRLAIKDDAAVTSYGVWVGLYDKQGRAPLVRGTTSMQIGTLIVEREGAVAKSVRFEPVASQQMPGSDPAPYLVDANTAKRVLDFGKVATNGAVVLQQQAGGMEIVPVPAGTVMTVGLQGKVASVSAWNAKGEKLSAPQLTSHDGKTWFETSADAVRYQVQ